jgi:hypothetical protein
MEFTVQYSTNTGKEDKDKMQFLVPTIALLCQQSNSTKITNVFLFLSQESVT